MVFGWEDKDDGSCWPNAKGYKCLPMQQCVQPTSVELLLDEDDNYKGVKTQMTDEHGGKKFLAYFGRYYLLFLPTFDTHFCFKYRLLYVKYF
jgi:hypothetical protein